MYAPDALGMIVEGISTATRIVEYLAEFRYYMENIWHLDLAKRTIEGIRCIQLRFRHKKVIYATRNAARIMEQHRRRISGRRINPLEVIVRCPSCDSWDGSPDFESNRCAECMIVEGTWRSKASGSSMRINTEALFKVIDDESKSNPTCTICWNCDVRVRKHECAICGRVVCTKPERLCNAKHMGIFHKDEEIDFYDESDTELNETLEYSDMSALPQINEVVDERNDRIRRLSDAARETTE